MVNLPHALPRTAMPKRVRFKRHLRFLEESGQVRAITTIDGGVDLPGGEPFQHLVKVLEPMPRAEELNAVLAGAMSVSEELATQLAQRLYATGLIETFDDADGRFARFDRQLHFFDQLAPVADHGENIARQERLERAEVLVLGLGGIGHQIALSLAAAGVGSLILVDGDLVEEGNLHRQILFAHGDTGRPKVNAARDGLLRIAPTCDVRLRESMIASAADWRALIAAFPQVRHVVISADRPIELVNWISDARHAYGYHAIKCGYMGAQGLIGPLLGPDTPGYEELFTSWAPLAAAQSDAVKCVNEGSVAPTLAAGNAIMANIAALELIKHITGAGSPALLGRRMLLDLRDLTTRIG